MGMIADQVRWKYIFPNVAPDVERAWGVEAMWLKRTDLAYDQWRQVIGERMDPSIRCIGYKSRVRGAHPATLVVVDDIHNDENAFSERELVRVKTFVNAELRYAMQPHFPFELWAGTPFHEEDVYAEKLKEGYDYILTPAALDQDGRPGWPGTPVWPEGLPAEEIQRRFETDPTGGAIFRREMLCDVSSSDLGQMPYQVFPHKEIVFDWPVWAGVDFASVPEPGARSRHRSHTAIAHLTKHPRGMGIVRGGELGQWTQGQTEEAMLRTQNRYTNFQFMGFDQGGKGELFLENLLSRNPNLTTVIPAPSGSKGKVQRIWEDLGPHLRNGSLMFSDDDTPFLRAARDFCRRFPNMPHPGSAQWDVMDSIHIAWRAMSGALFVAVPREHKPLRSANPYAMMAGRIHADG